MREKKRAKELHCSMNTLFSTLFLPSLLSLFPSPSSPYSPLMLHCLPTEPQQIQTVSYREKGEKEGKKKEKRGSKEPKLTPILSSLLLPHSLTSPLYSLPIKMHALCTTAGITT
jgi:hypothetical protein